MNNNQIFIIGIIIIGVIVLGSMSLVYFGIIDIEIPSEYNEECVYNLEVIKNNCKDNDIKILGTYEPQAFKCVFHDRKMTTMYLLKEEIESCKKR